MQRILKEENAVAGDENAWATTQPLTLLSEGFTQAEIDRGVKIKKIKLADVSPGPVSWIANAVNVGVKGISVLSYAPLTTTEKASFLDGSDRFNNNIIAWMEVDINFGAAVTLVTNHRETLYPPRGEVPAFRQRFLPKNNAIIYHETYAAGGDGSTGFNFTWEIEFEW